MNVTSIFIQNMNTKIIAHRGAWKEFQLPENSLASLQKAIELKCFGSEFDVHLTKDEVVVVNHDRDFYGIEIESNTYEDLLKIKHPNGEKLPTLNDYFNSGLKQNHTKLILEIKTSKIDAARTKKTADIIAKSLPLEAHPDRLEFILFDFETAIYLKKLLPDYQVHYLNGDKTAAEIQNAGLDGMDYYYKLLLQDRSIVSSFKKIGLKTNSWTTNDLETARQLIKQGIDCITTDVPQELQRENL